MKPEDILWVPPKRRKRLKPLFRRRTKYNTEPKRKKFSREELLEYLRVNDFRSARQLASGRKPGDPRQYDYRCEFGKWQNAKTEAFGVELSKLAGLESDDDFMIRSVIECNLWTQKAWRAKRKQMPDVFPSLHAVVRRWGRFSILTGLAKQRSLKSTMEEYRKLWNRIGRVPDMGEVREAGIELSKAIEHFKSKKALDAFMSGWAGDDA